MKYFFDTEFIEGFQKPIKWLPTIGSFNKPYHSIQLISIGIVCEDGRKYYAISNEFNPDDANDWVKENVISKLEAKNTYHYGTGIAWKSNKLIACDIMMFVLDKTGSRLKSWHGFLDDFYREMLKFEPSSCGEESPEFYAYYADYDWVVFCSLFGTMMDLPKGFPMYCKDLKQSVDDIVDGCVKRKEVANFKDGLFWLKHQDDYPTQKNEHDALDDARWNFKLYEYLKTL